MEQFDYGSVANDTAQVLSFLSIDQITSDRLAEMPSGACSQAGHCAITVSLWIFLPGIMMFDVCYRHSTSIYINFFRQSAPVVGGSRNLFAGFVQRLIHLTLESYLQLYSSCVDGVIDWSLGNHFSSRKSQKAGAMLQVKVPGLQNSLNRMYLWLLAGYTQRIALTTNASLP